MPEIFFLCFNYFENHPELWDVEGIFRVGCDEDKMFELECHLQMGDYMILE